MPKLFSDPEAIAEDIIRDVGTNLVVGLPLGLGKANHIVNALYRRAAADRAAEDPDYRFAVVQSENYRVHLRSAVETFDSVALARYLSHFARWYMAEERSPEVERVVVPVLERGVRGLGLEGA